MTRKQRSVYLVLGLVVGLFLTACAGVATGQIDVAGAVNVPVLGPAIEGLHLPELNFRPATLDTARQMELHRTVESAVWSGPYCLRGDH
jgi:hypothetical protein